MLHFPQVDLIVFEVVWQRLVEGDQVFEMNAQDGHLESSAVVVHAPVVWIVAVGRQQLCELTESLWENNKD